MKITFLEDELSICRMKPDTQVPHWAADSFFSSVTKTTDELSIVCESRCIPDSAALEREDGWISIMVEGPLPFSLTGILASLTVPLANADLGVFAISTFDTDYILIKKKDAEKARNVLSPLFTIIGGECS
ncbi:MAG: ACT domain-containing protein [Spirochaetales bacterium]|jgi:uncharacterized protein|nr:ACT domain-containing protein [Spirochaetales bacterium]